MTDHRTTAEQLIATAQPDSPDDRDQTIVGTALVHAVLALCDQLAEYGTTNEHAIDHAVLQQHADRARAAFPGTDQRLCMAEGRTPRGNRVVCSQPRDNHTRHSAGGYWWDDDGFSGSTLPPGTAPTMPHVVTSPRVCERRWSEMSGAHHECVLLAGHDTDRHQCECGAGCYDDEDDEDEGSSVCPADGCGRPDGHDGDHRAAEPLTLPTLTVKRGGLRYRGQTIETQGSTLHATPFVALHTSEGGDTSALATDVPDGSHEHGSAPAPDRLPPIVRSARTCADLTTNRKFAEVFMTCADVIEDLHRQVTVLTEQRDRESEIRLAAQDDLASTTASRDQLFETAKLLSQAIVHTVEYVGNDMLPAAEGWSWYDALREFHPDAANRFLTSPVHTAKPDADAIAGQWLVVRGGPNPAVFGAFRTADDAHTWATEHPDTVGTSLPTILPVIGPAR
ncbi:hypothetical protein SEA_AFFECA_56 [Gordonia phage Affeca]|nr:hypothetical protein SEA_AFFECA_56 [Gordonia phage Affeca]